MNNNKTLKIVLLIIISLALLIAIALGIILGAKLLTKECEPLTFLALKKFEIAAGIMPVEGDKCQLTKGVYLLRLIYEDEESAEQAKVGLELATPGERDEIEELTWITKDGNSSVFWTKDEKLGILVVIGDDSEEGVEKLLDKTFKKLK